MRNKIQTQQATTNNPSELVKSELLPTQKVTTAAPIVKERIRVTNIRKALGSETMWVATWPDGMQKYLTEAVIEDVEFSAVMRGGGCGASSDYKGKASGWLVSEKVEGEPVGTPIKFCRSNGYFYTGKRTEENAIYEADTLILKGGQGLVTKK